MEIEATRKVEFDTMIAKFMGGICTGNKWWFKGAEDPMPVPLPDYRKWHTLMPVWIKIMSWGRQKYGVCWEQSIGENAIIISNTRAGRLRIVRIYFRDSFLSIDHLYKAVANFMDWYYNNKQDRA